MSRPIEPITLEQCTAVFEALGYYPDFEDPTTFVSTGKVPGPKAPWFVLEDDAFIWPELFFLALKERFQFREADAKQPWMPSFPTSRRTAVTSRLRHASVRPGPLSLDRG